MNLADHADTILTTRIGIGTQMQVTFNGLERTLTEMIALTASAGWKIVRVGRAEGSLFGHIVAVPAPVPTSTLDLDLEVAGSADDVTPGAIASPVAVSPKNDNINAGIAPLHDSEPNEGRIIRSSADIEFSPAISQSQLALSEAASTPHMQAFTSSSTVDSGMRPSNSTSSSMYGPQIHWKEHNLSVDVGPRPLMQPSGSSSTMKNSAWNSYTTDEALDRLASASGGSVHRTTSSGRTGAGTSRPGRGSSRPGSSSGRSMFGYGSLPAHPSTTGSNGTIVYRGLNADLDGKRAKGKGTGSGGSGGWMRWVKGKKAKSGLANEVDAGEGGDHDHQMGSMTTPAGMNGDQSNTDGKATMHEYRPGRSPLPSSAAVSAAGSGSGGESRAGTPRGGKSIMKKVSQMFNDGSGGGGTV